MLLRSQQIAGAADFQVAHGNFEARAQFRKVADGLESFGRHFAQDLILFVDKVGIGQARRPTDPSPHLIQLGEAKVFRPLDDNRIGHGHVEAVFDNGRAQENIAAAFVEVHHGIFQGLFAHASVTHADFDTRHKAAQARSNGGQAGNAIVHVIDAAAAAQFPLQGLLDHAVAVFGHIRFHRQAVFRRRFNNAHIPRVDEGHVERPRNRRGGQGQDIDALLPLLDLFLLGHAKALFLVDNEESQVQEDHVSL